MEFSSNKAGIAFIFLYLKYNIYYINKIEKIRKLLNKITLKLPSLIIYILSDKSL